MSADVVAQSSESVPRYTSYPTAPHFHPGIGADASRDWLTHLPAGEPISLYLHVPYCDRLCWFCACHTKQTLRYEPVTAFLRGLYAEIATVGALVGAQASVGAIHLGGGSPTMLRRPDMVELRRRLNAAFTVLPDAEISIEIDANDLDDDRFEGMAEFGLTRASFGIQDFDPVVQKAINRLQSFEQTRLSVEGVRARGARSVNLDLLYGLPHQTLDTLKWTMEMALSLNPDRLALFGYAHVPWFKKHQTMIDEAALPDARARYDQMTLAASMCREAGYVQIGFDHFARPGDSLAVAAASGTLRRNFQGYTDDACETIVGLGPSSISSYAQGYCQNIPSTNAYERVALAGDLATARGVAVSADDLARRWVIERLMCDFGFSATQALSKHGKAAEPILADAQALCASRGDAFERRSDWYVVSEASKPFVRSIAAHFDAYLHSSAARHSVAV
jgi:oxygen-independent coproporphyrinogen-3 oxidase